MEIWVVAYRRFYKVFLVSMALFLGGNMVLQKIESRRRKNNSRQQNIIDYLLKGMLEELSNDKNHICGGKYGGGHTLPLGNSTSVNS